MKRTEKRIALAHDCDAQNFFRFPPQKDVDAMLERNR
jgi:hypothetical protein